MYKQLRQIRYAAKQHVNADQTRLSKRWPNWCKLHSLQLIKEKIWHM